MNTSTRIAAFAAGLAAVFAASVGVGSAVGRVGGDAAGANDGAAGSGHDTGGHSGGNVAGTSAQPAGGVPGGVSASRDGYLLRVAQPTLPAGTATTFAFEVLAPDGSVLTSYSRSHDKELHLIIARRDLATFVHVHPTRDAAGRWSVPLTLAESGPYKVFADFVPTGRSTALVLAADLTVPGNYDPVPHVADSTTATVDGYRVTLDGNLVPGTDSRLTLSVAKDGRPVTDLQPYLAAYGHLVALRASDLAYLHVHPAGEPGDGHTNPGPDITFYAGVPSAGTYRLFLDFQHAGVVRTAAFTLDTEAAGHGADSSGTHGHAAGRP